MTLFTLHPKKCKSPFFSSILPFHNTHTSSFHHLIRTNVCDQTEVSPLHETQVPEKIPELLQLYDVAKSNRHWNALNLRVPSTHQLRSMCTSVFRMDLPSGSEILSELSPMECYTALGLNQHLHGRLTSTPLKLPGDRASTIHWIGSSDDSASVEENRQHFYSVVRREHPIFQTHCAHASIGGSGDDLKDLKDLARAVVTYCVEKGVPPDPNRSQPTLDDNTPTTRQYRINVGSVSQAKKEIVGRDFFDFLKTKRQFNVDHIKHTIGNTALLAWLCQDDLQEAAGGPKLSPDKVREEMFAKPLRDFLGMKGNAFKGEDITVVVGVLSPNFDGCVKHYDTLNDWRIGYDRTATFNAVLLSDDNKVAISIQVSAINSPTFCDCSLSHKVLIETDR